MVQIKQETTVYGPETEEYQRWIELEGEVWTDELDTLCRQGMTLEYKNNEDIFVLTETL